MTQAIDAAFDPDATWATFDDRRPRRRSDAPQGAGEEELRFIRNFHDVFLSIGLAMFAVGLAFVTSLLVADAFRAIEFDGVRPAAALVAGAGFLNAAILWMVGEVFARRRRLFLPAIVILLAFAAATFVGFVGAYVAVLAPESIAALDGALADEAAQIEAVAREFRWLPTAAFGAQALAIFAFYARMKLPFAMGFGAASLAGAGIAYMLTVAANPLEADPAQFYRRAQFMQLFGGVFLFFLGVAFDARDPDRRTRFSDNAFWLHFFAAPMIFGATLSLVQDDPFDPGARFGVMAAVVTLLVVSAFALVSLLINRRALLVSGLVSAALAIGVLVNEVGLSGAWTAALTLLLLGGAMVLLGGGWHTVRRALVKPFPKSGPIARIVPPEPDPDAEDGVGEE